MIGFETDLETGNHSEQRRRDQTQHAYEWSIDHFMLVTLL